MAASLDYAGFPHIFARIVEYCDQPTQNRLRLLSSSAKCDVDRHHCRYVYFAGSLSDYDPEGHDADSPYLLALSEPPTAAGFSFWRTPLLPQGPFANERDRRSMLWALRNTRHAAVKETDLFDAEAERAVHEGSRLRHLSSRCTDLTLSYRAKYLGGKGRRVLNVPSTVRRLHVLLTMLPSLRGDESWGVTLTHSSPQVLVELDEGSSGERTNLTHALATIDGLLTPCVQALVLRVHRADVVGPYLRSIEQERLHPDLRIIVSLVEQVDTRSLRDEWAGIIDAEVEVLQRLAEP